MSATKAITMTTDKGEPKLRLPRPLPWVTLLLAGASILIMVVPGASQLLQYEHFATSTDQWWRPFTCHLAHWSAKHLFWDVLMFVTLGAIVEMHDRKSFGVTVVASACLIPPLLTNWMPGLETYRGLSGIDSALTGLIATTILCEHRRVVTWSWERTIALAALAGLAMKMIYEGLTGSAVFVPSNTEMSVPLAHLVGASCGISVGGSMKIREVIRSVTSKNSTMDVATRVRPYT